MNPLNICIDEAFRRGTLRGAVERATTSCIDYHTSNGTRNLTFDNVRDIVEALDAYGVFEVRGSVNKVAKSTGVARTTVYKMLKK